MYYVYLLFSNSTSKYYIGSTEDLKRRFAEHNELKNIATKSGAPWSLEYYEAYKTKEAALLREQKLKHHGKGLYEIKRRLQ